MTTWRAIIQETHIRASFTAPRRLRWRGPGCRGRPPSGQDSTTETVAGRALGRQETGRVGTDPRTDGDEPQSHETLANRGRVPIYETHPVPRPERPIRRREQGSMRPTGALQ